MKYFVIGIVMGLIVGVIIATADHEKRVHPLKQNNLKIDSTKVSKTKVDWRLVSLFPRDMLPKGVSASNIAEKINYLTEKTLHLKHFEPGSILPAFKSFEAVSSGRIEAAITNPSFWGSKSSSFELLGGIPFGANVNEYLAWYQTGGGKQIYKNLYRRFNIHALICGVMGPDFGGWFKGPVNKLSDLQGKVVAAAGLSAIILSRAGVHTRLLPPQNIGSAISSGKVFGSTIGGPYKIPKNESNKSVGYVYFPGWQKQFGILDLIINLSEWNKLSVKTKNRIEVACSSNIIDSLSVSEGRRFDTLKSIVGYGVEVKRWPRELLDKLRFYWRQEIKTQRFRDGEFGRIWSSRKKFSEDYSIWEELGYL